MSYVKDNTISRELEEDFFYHVSESDYHLEQYLKATQEAENHLSKYREHCNYRFDISVQLKAVNRALLCG